MLSRLAQEFAAEIANHDWSDAPYRLDRAGHHREHDSNRGSKFLENPEDVDRIRTNVMWVTAQVLMHSDPNLKILEYAEACGIPTSITHNRDGRPSGILGAGIRRRDDQVATPGPWA